jgi:prepilin-type N-terminal cleavage/methylation domain-containing protein
MKKQKAFTLIETLVAALIFVVVVTIAATSFSMIRKSSAQTDGLALSVSCAGQLEDFVSSKIREANYGDIVYGIKKQGNAYTAVKPTVGSQNFVGIALLTAADSSTAIFKDQGMYLVSTVHSIDPVEIGGALASGASRIQSDDCNAVSPTDNGNLTQFNLDFTSPFTVIPGDHFYHFILQDIDYASPQSQLSSNQQDALSRELYSRVYVDVLNKAGGI